MTQATGSSVTADLLALLGPDAVARLARPLTHAEDRLVAEALARHGGDPVSALGVDHLPEDTKAEIRRVMTR